MSNHTPWSEIKHKRDEPRGVLYGQSTVDALRARIAELEAQNLALFREGQEQRNRIAELEAVNDNEIRLCHEHVAELKREMEQLDRYCDDLRALLREALPAVDEIPGVCWRRLQSRIDAALGTENDQEDQL